MTGRPFYIVRPYFYLNYYKQTYNISTKNNKGQAMARTNYLNNRELLKEIHNSKVSFCSFTDDMYAMFDAIVYSVEDIDSKLIKQTLQDKADRLTKDRKYKAKELKLKTPIIPVTVEELKVEELVFRVMCHEHIPVDEEKLKKAKTEEQKKIKTNFPPFRHYIVESYIVNRLGNYKELSFREVGKSHWEGGLSNGYFRMDHGMINDKLARMFMKLVERYAQRGNWRGYTYNDEMRSQALLQLSQVGLQFNEAKSSNPFSYYTETINNSFTRVLNMEKKSQNIRDDLLIANNATPSFSKQYEHEEEMKRLEALDTGADLIIKPRRGRRKKSETTST